MNFKAIKTWREERFSVGIETTTNTPYLDFPVSLPKVEYVEFYRIPREWIEDIDGHLEDIRAFVERARKQKPPPEGEDDKLILPANSIRGEPS
jgi:hypothetical protein